MRDFNSFMDVSFQENLGNWISFDKYRSCLSLSCSILRHSEVPSIEIYSLLSIRVHIPR